MLLWHWLSFPLSRRNLSCYVDCTESHQEAQRPTSSQDVGSEEESGEKIHDNKVASAVYYHTITLITQRLHKVAVWNRLWSYTFSGHLTTQETCCHDRHISDQKLLHNSIWIYRSAKNVMLFSQIYGCFDLCVIPWLECPYHRASDICVCIYLCVYLGWRKLGVTCPIWKWAVDRGWSAKRGANNTRGGQKTIFRGTSLLY